MRSTLQSILCEENVNDQHVTLLIYQRSNVGHGVIEFDHGNIME